MRGGKSILHKETVRAQWRTGGYTLGDLAELHKVTKPAIRHVVKGIEQDQKHIVEKMIMGIEEGYELNESNTNVQMSANEIHAQRQIQASRDIDNYLMEGNHKLGKGIGSHEVGVDNPRDLCIMMKTLGDVRENMGIMTMKELAEVEAVVNAKGGYNIQMVDTDRE